MRIHKYTPFENLLSLIIAGLLSECLCIVYLMYHISSISYEDQPKIKPVYEKIIEYADDDPIVKKAPVDIIEETEDEIIEDAKMVILPELSLTSTLGRIQGPQEEETYYNLPMENVIENMRKLGYTDEDYPYYIREDGVKMLGDFIIVATDLTEYSKGTVVQTSLGQGLVCDKCEPPDTIDIAVEW